MATIQYVINAINNASSVLNDIANSAARMDAAMSAADVAAGNLNKAMLAQGVSGRAAADALSKLTTASAAAAGVQKALASSLGLVGQQGAFATMAMKAGGDAAKAASVDMALAAGSATQLGQGYQNLAVKAELAAIALRMQAAAAKDAAAAMISPGPLLHPVTGQPANLQTTFWTPFTDSGTTAATVANLNSIAAATRGAGTAAYFAGGGFRGFWGALGAQIPLFGGAGVAGIMKSIAVWHLAADALIEIAAVAIPAGIAVGVWGAAAASTFSDMYTKVSQFNTVAAATGMKIYPITGAFQALQAAAKPSAMLLMGDAMVVVDQRAAGLRPLIVGVGNALDQIGARAAAAFTSKSGFSTLMTQAIPDVQKLGDVVFNVFGTIGNLLHAVPGIATILLNVVDKTTKGIENFTSSGVVQGITKVGLAFHGAAIYVGLAATAIQFGLRGAATIAGNFAEKAGMALLNTDRFGAAGARAGAALLGFGADAAGAAGFIAGPWGLAIIAGATALGFLIDKIVTAQSSVQKLGAQIQTAVSKSPASSSAGVAAGLLQAQQLLGSLAYTVPKSSFNTSGYFPKAGIVGGAPPSQITPQNLPQNIQQAIALVHRQAAEVALYNQRLQSLVPTFGSVQAAQNALSASGVTMGQFLDRNAAHWAQVKVAAQAAQDVYVKFGMASATAQNDATILGRTTSDQVVAMTQLNQAWDQYIAAVQGSRIAFNTYFAQGAAIVTAQKAAKGNLDGLTQQSIAYNQAVQQQVTNTESLISAWRLAGVAGNTLNGGIKAAIAPMLQMAKTSPTLTAELSALAAAAGYQGPPVWKNLAAFVGTANGAYQKMAAVTAQATIQQALLTTAMKGQGAYIANQLSSSLQLAILKYSHVQTAINNYGQALATFGSHSQQAASAQTKLITALIAAGKAAGDTTGQIGALIAKILGIPLKRAIQIVINAEGHWSITGGIAGYTGSASYSTTFGNTGFVGHGMATGGYVRGGMPGRDSVPIMAMPGEVVIPTHMVRAGAIDHLKGTLPGFASGGAVGGAGSALGSWAQSSYSKTVANGVTGMRAIATRELQIGLTSALNAGVGKAKGGMIYDQGGWLPPGTSMATNNTGQSEQIVGPQTAAQQSQILQQILTELRTLNQQTANEPAQVGAAVTAGFSGAARPARLNAYYSTRVAHG